ncbi:glycoside hydrolase family 140 protein [Arcticibacter eurypsychrophilus]|uniref:glycoside hydrolase family 140 protein n=1 Tax=Arcticibacter eurypsychrophilus TaxID=1434752 RepID=UPI00084D4E68|nr:glycoside hydrolase family 140 protein [Arcticibacter eurypsychrophilus]
MRHIIYLSFLVLSVVASCNIEKKEMRETGPLKVSENGRYLLKENGDPFFWLGDTGWLLFGKLNREEADKYLEDRSKKGFNVIQVMVLHGVGVMNFYGDSALINHDVSKPNVTKGNAIADSTQYDYWDHVDYIVDKAAEKGLYMALVPIWGSDVKGGNVSVEQAATYTKFLTERYKNRPNVIWMNGGDIKGSDSLAVWQTIGNGLRKGDPNHLITFHPRGRTSSTEWFHNEKWLDFNMFQSGHRRYDQDTTAKEKNHYGEDNWKHVQYDYALKPAKPTIDGEPSYEGIPQGLHDTTEVRWTDSDVRRYGYWSVFAGAFGYTYGQNSVMQMHTAKDVGSAYGSHQLWDDAINEPGAGQMVHLKTLMLSKPFLERVPDQSILAENGDKYNYQVATRGAEYAFIYTYNGRNIKVHMGKIAGDKVKASWFNPRDGKTTAIAEFPNTGTHEFDPPADIKNGNDWVLVLEKA